METGSTVRKMWSGTRATKPIDIIWDTVESRRDLTTKKNPAYYWLVMINSNASSLIVHIPCGDNLANPNHNLYTRFLALFLVQILNLGGRPTNTPNKALISCSYLITMRTLHSPHMLIIYYTEVSTLLIQEVALAPIN